jgi:Flp pilus assembly protein TadD
MHGKRLLVIGFVGFAVTIGGLQPAQAGDLKITIPKRSTLTPVQRLNREGVEALRQHHYAKAEQLFYKAYLFDPDDAFTLNNLGYISELLGQIDRAQNFYSLAAEQSSEAVIDRASVRRVEGRPMKEALAMSDQPLQINHANVEAVRLLSQGRAPEADLLLEETLKIDSHNVFTLNNLGVAKEMEGEAGEALQFYDQAAGVRSDASAVVTGNRTWRGKPVSEMAQQNAKALRDHLAGANDLIEQVAELNLQGVSAVNRNDLRSADRDFRKAYALNPNDAFTLNNIGYVAELDGDRETAQFFYDRARQTGGATATVGVASRRTEEGKKLFAVAGDSDSRVEAKVTQDREALRRRHEPVVLRRRDNSIVQESEQPPAPADGTQPPQ